MPQSMALFFLTPLEAALPARVRLAFMSWVMTLSLFLF